MNLRLKSFIFFSAICFSGLSFAFAKESKIDCVAVETAGESAKFIQLSPSRGPLGELNFTASSETYDYTIKFSPPEYQYFWALIETKPSFKPAYHAEGALRPRESDPSQKIAVLEFYTDLIDVKLQCTKK